MEQQKRRRSERMREERERATPPTEKPMEPETKYGTVVDCQLLNFRSAPDMHDPKNIIGTLKPGVKLEILDHEGIMTKVRVPGGSTGWVASTYCKED